MFSKELLTLAMRETVSRSPIIRKPIIPAEGNALTDEELKKAQETIARALIPVYHFNALATSRLVAPGGLLLALGAGAGHYIMYLAQRRPDMQIIGIESDERLVSLGQHLLELNNLTERVSINLGQSTGFVNRIPTRLDMITSVLSLHELANADDLTQSLHEISLARIRSGSAVWLFDFSRPKAQNTADEFPATLMPGSPPQFRRDIRNSLMAAFNYTEMSEYLDKVSLGTVNHAGAKQLRVYQAHWLERDDNYQAQNNNLWQENKISAPALLQFKQISSMFPKVPLPTHLK